MNKLLLFFLLLIFAGCGKTKNKTIVNESESFAVESVFLGKNGVLITDVTKEYPKSERINIQDIADVEYIPLETKKDFLCSSGGTISYIDDSIIIYINRREGDILIFDREGKAKQKINKKGQSGKEYGFLNSLCYDKEKNEFYVNDMMTQKIVVYDVEGNYKRSFRHLPESTYNPIYLFNDQYLLCYNNRIQGFDKEMNPYKIVSKQTGELIKELDIPFSKRISSTIYYREGDFGGKIAAKPYPEPIIKNGDTWVLNEISTDTIYLLSADLKLTPLMVQTPSVQSMGESPKYLSFVMDSYNYQFMFIQKKELDIKTLTGFPTTAIMFDKKNKKVLEQNFYDVNRPEKVYEFYLENTNKMAKDNQYYGEYPAFRLKKYLEKGELKGRLKEIAEKIEEDDNNVLMIIKFKKTF